VVIAGELENVGQDRMKALGKARGGAGSACEGFSTWLP